MTGVSISSFLRIPPPQYVFKLLVVEANAVGIEGPLNYLCHFVTSPHRVPKTFNAHAPANTSCTSDARGVFDWPRHVNDCFSDHAPCQFKRTLANRSLMTRLEGFFSSFFFSFKHHQRYIWGTASLCACPTLLCFGDLTGMKAGPSPATVPR